MTFTVGETVVYPNHGAAVIEDIEMRTIKGEEKQYLVLRIVGQTDLVVRVPACNLDLVGVRDVVDADGLERVFGVLRAAHAEEPTNWSRRYKANLEKLHSGDVMKVAEGVRDLVRRGRARRPAGDWAAAGRRRGWRAQTSGCWPRRARSSSPSWPWPSTPTRTRPRRSSTRSSRPRTQARLQSAPSPRALVSGGSMLVRGTMTVSLGPQRNLHFPHAATWGKWPFHTGPSETAHES